MKLLRVRGLILVALLCGVGATPQAREPLPTTLSPRTILLFDFDWKFHRGGAQGAERPSFNDSLWRNVDLPHDWSIEDIPGTFSPFDQYAVGQVSSGFTEGGTGWYRKSFTLPPTDGGKRVYIQFDGVYMNADVWLNGAHLGNHPYGYTSFWFDVTGTVRFDTLNVLAVQVKNEGQTSRWYSGSGIYRHVWIKLVDPLHVVPWGIFVTTPKVSPSDATVNVRTKISNTGRRPVPVAVVTRLISPQRVEVAHTRSQQTVQPETTMEFTQSVGVISPEFWSIETPVLYNAVSEVYSGAQLLDRVETPFGIRTISFDGARGFLLNGRAVELKGGCVHHDNGPLGARAYDRAEERRVELLKASGFNAVRCAHNPPSPAFLDACDRLGMLVIDEAFDMWINPNNPHDYHLYFDDWWQRDIESMVLRDRNHPSIFLWSIGNEIRGMETPEVVEVARRLAAYGKSLDLSRPVTAAVNSVNEKKDPFFAALDVAGYNYARSNYISDHLRKPDRLMFCSESFPLEAYEYWTEATAHPWVIGDFVWTAFDYIGEASIGWRGYWQESNFYPWTLAFCGDIDICGWKRPQSYYRDVLWSNGGLLSIFVNPPAPSFPPNPKREGWSLWHWDDVVADWNWSGYDNQPLDVVVYSRCERVELFLNGTSLDTKETSPATQFMATWRVPYQPGELRAVGYTHSTESAVAYLRSAGRPVKLSLTADRAQLRADGQDLSYVTVELLDEWGVRNPKAEDLVTFELTGPGSIVAVGNADPMSVESYQQPQRKAWHGRCLAVVKSGREKGEVTLKATVRGIPPALATMKIGE